MNTTELKRVQLAVRAIITDSSGKVLILKRADNSLCGGFWNLPGGKVDFGETAEEAMAKEILEEVSLVTDNLKFLFYMDNLPNEQTELHFVTLFFLCNCSENVKLNSESSEYKWIVRDELELFDFAFDHDKAILNYTNNNG
jgi:8-oxo-dGTP diphosphatase